MLMQPNTFLVLLPFRSNQLLSYNELHNYRSRMWRVRSTNSSTVSLPIYLPSPVISPSNSLIPSSSTSNNSLPIKQNNQLCLQAGTKKQEKSLKKSEKQESISLRSLPLHYPLLPRSSLTPRFSLSQNKLSEFAKSKSFPPWRIVERCHERDGGARSRERDWNPKNDTRG